MHINKMYLKKTLIYSLLVFSLLLVSVALFSQRRGALIVTGILESDNNPIANGDIRVSQDRYLVERLGTNALGRFEFFLQFDRDYIVEFSAPGMASKKLKFDAHLPEGLSRRPSYEFYFVVDLFAYVEEVDLSFLDDPIATIEFDAERNNEFIFPATKYSANLSRVAGLKSEVEAYLRRDQRYSDLVRQADELYSRDELRNSLNYYVGANEIFPDREHPISRINAINEILASRDEMQDNYQQLIDLADKSFSVESYEEAIDHYTSALVVRPDASYPKRQIKEARKLIEQALQQAEQSRQQAELARQQEAHREAAAREQARQQAELARQQEAQREAAAREQARQDSIFRVQAALNERYNSLIVLADNHFNDNQLTQARDNYTEALKIKSGEAYPRQQIAEINSILGSQERELAEYNAAISRGDQFFNRQNYILARDAYREALTIRPDEAYPANQLMAISDLIAQMRQRDEAYMGLIRKADSLFSGRNYQQAKVEYEKALEIKSGEAHPRQRITEINSILGSQERDLAAYNSVIRRADQFFNQRNYPQARDAYREALALRPGEAYPRNKISEIEALLQAAYSESLSYQQNIEQGDRLFNQLQYFASRDAYHRALNINPGAEYPIGRIQEINKLILRSEEMNAFYSRGYMEISGVKEIIENNSENTYYIVPFSRRRSGSYIEMKVMNNSDRSIRVFVNYGVNRSRHGGIAVLVPPSADYQSVGLNVSSQPSWISYDNNWISLSPVGGDIDVEYINVVFGD